MAFLWKNFPGRAGYVQSFKNRAAVQWWLIDGCQKIGKFGD